MEGLVTDVDTLVRPAPPRRTASALRPPARVLVTGADGYIGSVLAPTLMERGYDVVGLDTGYYRSGWLYHDGRDRPAIRTRDVRDLTADDVAGFDAVVHLAELSNDPLCENDPQTTYAINHLGSVALAELCRDAGVKRFVYASSCSVYGTAGNGAKTEESPTNPLTAYAECKLGVERGVISLTDDHFSPTFLRNATAFGASPRMRFDLVLNNLAGVAFTTGRIVMTSDGSPWRPLVHIRDISAAVVGVLEAPREAVAGEIFNVGDDTQNYRVHEIAEVVARVFPGCELEFGSSAGDDRSYRVSFGKIRKHLPEFRCRWDLERGARELRGIFERIGMTEQVFTSAGHTRLKQLKHLVETGQLASDFRWNAHAVS